MLHLSHHCHFRVQNLPAQQFDELPEEGETALPVIKPVSGNSILFNNAGTLYSPSVYGHLISPLNLSDVIHQSTILEEIIGDLDSTFKHYLFTMENLSDNMTMNHKLKYSASLRYYAAENSSFDNYADYYEIAQRNTMKVQTLSQLLIKNAEPEQGHRQKRSIMAVLSGIANVISLGASVVNRLSISKLQDAFFRQDSTIKIIGNVVKATAMHVNENRNKILELQNKTQLLTQEISLMQKHTYIRDLASQIKDLIVAQRELVSNLEFNVNSLLHGQLPLTLFQMDHLQEAFMEFRTIAETHNLHTLTDNSFEIINSPHSLVFKDQVLYVISHVLLHDNNKFAVFQYINFLHKLNFNNTEMVVQVKDDHTYLALDRAGGSFIALKERDMEECVIKDAYSLYFCPQLTIATKNNHRSCIASLFHQNEKDILEFCDLDLVKEDSLVKQISHTGYRVYTKEELKSTVQCKGETSWTQFPKGISDLELPPGCTISTSNFVIYNKDSFKFQSEYLEIKMPQILPRLMVNYSGLPELMKKFGDITLSNIDLQTLQAIKTINEHVVKDQIAVHAGFTNTMIFSLFGILSIIILYLAWQLKQCTCPRHSHQQSHREQPTGGERGPIIRYVPSLGLLGTPTDTRRRRGRRASGSNNPDPDNTRRHEPDPTPTGTSGTEPGGASEEGGGDGSRGGSQGTPLMLRAQPEVSNRYEFQ